MFSKVLDNFTGVFLILYISATSATPTVQPEEANKINSTIHARAYQPYQCVDPFLWLRRECVGALGSRVWQDVCAYSANVAGAQIHYDNKEGTCPYNTYCLDNFKPSEGSRFIRCVPGNPSSTGSVLGKRKRDPQSDTKRARPDLGNTQFQYSVTIDHDMTEAAVAAVVASEDDEGYLVAPNNIIVGNLHGKKQVLCKGDKSSPTKARECYPNAAYNFKKGDVIDYTWGMTNDQEGSLLYAIMPE